MQTAVIAYLKRTKLSLFAFAVFYSDLDINIITVF